MLNIVEKARLVALAAYAACGKSNQCQQQVAIDELIESSLSDEVLAAAWLGRVVQDTALPLSLIVSEFGHRIADLVESATRSKVVYVDFAPVKKPILCFSELLPRRYLLRGYLSHEIVGLQGNYISPVDVRIGYVVYVGGNNIPCVITNIEPVEDAIKLDFAVMLVEEPHPGYAVIAYNTLVFCCIKEYASIV